MIEVWKDVEEFKGHYQVSNFGRIKSLDKFVHCGNRFNKNLSLRIFPGKIKKVSPNKKGYLRVCLSVSGKRYMRFVHKLVLLAFGGPQPEGTECSHIDGDRGNNFISNLVWETHFDNMQRTKDHGTFYSKTRGEDHYASTLTEEDVLKIRSFGNKLQRKEVARMYGVCQSTISNVVLGKTWKHLLI